MSRPKVTFKTIGCRANQADTAMLRRSVFEAGAEILTGLEQADFVVINTCCVTAEAQRDCRKLARRALRESPLAKVIFTGCAVSAIANFGKDIDDRVILLGGGDLDLSEMSAHLNNIIGSSFDNNDNSEPKNNRSYQQFAGRTRALLKIQNGCEHYCSYCIVPFARGPEKSMPISEVFDNVSWLKNEGYLELVLSGVQIGAWGKDLPGTPHLSKLIADVADRFAPGRVRLSSIEPWSVNDALIEVVAGHTHVCPHLHVPLQSGDDNVLKAMGRGYSADDFTAIAHKIVKYEPNLAFGTDIICGFPGEDELAFQNTLALLRDIPLAYLHAFPYSERAGTRAVSIRPRSDRATAKKRVRIARELGNGAATKFETSQLGKIRELLIETTNGENARGITDNYLHVTTAKVNKHLLNVRLELDDDKKLIGVGVLL